MAGRPRDDEARPRSVPARRFSRLSPREKQGLAFAYAVSVADGHAAICDPHYQGPYREMFVLWGDTRWMVTQRFLATARRARQFAERQAEGEGGEYAERISVWLRRLARRAADAPDEYAEIDRRFTALRGSQSPNRMWLSRHLASQRRRQRRREEIAKASAATRDFVASLDPALLPLLTIRERSLTAAPR